MLPPLNSVRAAARLLPLGEADELFRRPPLLLYMTAEPFEYRRRAKVREAMTHTCGARQVADGYAAAGDAAAADRWKSSWARTWQRQLSR